MGSRMRWGSWDWVCASPDCLNDSGFGLGGPHEVAGPSTYWNSGSGVVETFWRSQWYLEVQGAHTRKPITFNACCCVKPLTLC